MAQHKRKGVIQRFTTRTLRGRPLGFEAYMWAAQRITGVIIFGFLMYHLYTLSTIFESKAAFDQVMKRFQRPLIKFGELLLVWIILVHALNGLRLILLNLFPGLNHKQLAYYASGASLILFLCSIPVFF
jgi:succinate dehydrogenase / fumarate reductase cytochrome b subunit